MYQPVFSSAQNIEIYFSVLLLINEQLTATKSPNRTHGNAAPINSLIIFILLAK